VLHDLSLTIPAGRFTAIIGPNACGKSTLLRALARVSPIRAGSILLDGAAIATCRTRDVARRLGLLPQASVAPDGITVQELVARGRYPHQSMLRNTAAADAAAVVAALGAAGITELAARPVDELSGGQRQRVWIALVLAQSTPLLLLDEPTTALDIGHQVELMNLLRRLNHAGRTVVAVLHDLPQACRYAEHLIVMQAGRIVTEGRPWDMMTPELMHRVFGLRCLVIEDPVAGTPLIIPSDDTRVEDH